MKSIQDIETLLIEQAAPKPRRALRQNFTTSVIEWLKENPKPKQRPWWQRYLQFQKPAIAFASLIIIITLTATAYAATDGFTRLPSFLNIRSAEQKTLPSGERIISIDTQGCKLVEWEATANKLAATDRTYMYRLRTEAAMTTDEVAQMVQGKCEFEAQTGSGVRQSALERYSTKHPADIARLVGGYASEIITAITPTSLTTRGEQLDNGAIRKYDLTFQQISPDVTVVSENSQPIQWADLRVGDSIAYVYVAIGNALNKSEITPSWMLQTSETTIVYVEKNSQNVRAYFDYTNHYGIDFEQVVPCENGSNGYCSKFGPIAPPRTELDNSPASITIQDAYMYLSNSYESYLNETRPDAIRELRQKFLASFSPELRSKIELTPNYSAALCGHTITEFYTPQNAKQSDGDVVRDILFTAIDGSSFTVRLTANTKTNLITDISCEQ